MIRDGKETEFTTRESEERDDKWTRENGKVPSVINPSDWKFVNSGSRWLSQENLSAIRSDQVQWMLPVWRVQSVILLVQLDSAS